jgi:predicted small lipoprotein YifL
MILIATAVITASLAACGRKGDVRAPPGDEDSDYPRPYPAATVP